LPDVFAIIVYWLVMAGIEIATGELMKGKEQSFIEKYGLEGNGVPVRISKSTQLYVQELRRKGQRAIEAGEYYAKTTKHRFG
jgi:hypothetical protein